MVNISSVCRVALLLGLMPLSLRFHARGSEYPNIVFILAEDCGFEINKDSWASDGSSGRYFTPNKNPKLAGGPAEENLSIRLGYEMVSFMHEHKKEHKKKPFFVFFSFYAVHGLIQTTEENWTYFRNKAEQLGIKENGFLVDRTLSVRQTQDNLVYAELIKQMDDAIGVVLDAIEEMGLDKNMMIVFTNDNDGIITGDAYSSSQLSLRSGKGRQ